MQILKVTIRSYLFSKVFQKRFSDNVDFNRKHKQGSGDMDGDIWLGKMLS